MCDDDLICSVWKSTFGANKIHDQGSAEENDPPLPTPLNIPNDILASIQQNGGEDNINANRIVGSGNKTNNDKKNTSKTKLLKHSLSSSSSLSLSLSPKHTHSLSSSSSQ